jgi:insertion element IS1 protein InsB
LVETLLKKKRWKLWIWKARDRDTGQLLDRECGRRDKATLKQYASVIPQDKLVPSKATTPAIERNHRRQRYWFGRFKRKSIIVSESKEMVELTMSLFAKFRNNGNQDELISLLA